MDGLWTDCPGTPGKVETEREESVDTIDKFLSEVSGCTVCLSANRTAGVLVPNVDCTLPCSAADNGEASSLLNTESSSAVSPM